MICSRVDEDVTARTILYAMTGNLYAMAGKATA